MVHSFLPFTIFIAFILILSKVESEVVEVWKFRTNGSNFENIPNVKVLYTGPKFDQSLTDFTICFRYEIYVLHSIRDTYKIFRAKSLENAEKMTLEVSGKWDSEFKIWDNKGIHLLLFFTFCDSQCD